MSVRFLAVGFVVGRVFLYGANFHRGWVERLPTQFEHRGTEKGNISCISDRVWKTGNIFLPPRVNLYQRFPGLGIFFSDFNAPCRDSRISILLLRVKHLGEKTGPRNDRILPFLLALASGDILLNRKSNEKRGPTLPTHILRSGSPSEPWNDPTKPAFFSTEWVGRKG